MPLVATRGAASAQGFGEFAQSAPANYIEDVFSTYLYTGNGSTQTITNGIDLAGKGGLVWTKQRNGGAVAQDNGHALIDTVRGRGSIIQSNTTAAALAPPAGYQISSFGSSGYTLGADYWVAMNDNASPFASWTFRKQPKFFDIVTYTGDGTNGRQIAHSLGATPGCIIAKCTSTTQGWDVWHRTFSNTTQNYLQLNTTAAVASFANVWGTQTSTYFTVGSGGSNISGRTYVAYLFAHDAGGFGAAGTDNVISCGSYTGNGSATGPSITLGYEPQWVMIKNSSGVGNWYMLDTMRGMAYTVGNELYANLSAGEVTQSKTIIPTATGFNVATTDGYVNNSGSTYIYIAIRRGPMKTPTSGTSVFSPVTANPSGNTDVTTNFPVDLVFSQYRTGGENDYVFDRLRGSTLTAGTALQTQSTASENTYGYGFGFDYNTKVVDGFWNPYIGVSSNMVYWNFRRAPGFFDEVCYTGDAVNPRTISHNLSVAPELIIVKKRNNIGNWFVYSLGTGATNYLVLDATDASASGGIFNNTTPTSASFQVYGTSLNANGSTYVAYLFATVAGVSKVGSYTGTGTTQQINCGFTSGARFVLIKRTDSTGNWYVWDSARGIVAGNDPYLLLNSTAAEVTNTDYVDTYSAGFEISSTAPAAINASGGTFIYLAIA